MGLNQMFLNLKNSWYTKKLIGKFFFWNSRNERSLIPGILSQRLRVLIKTTFFGGVGGIKLQNIPILHCGGRFFPVEGQGEVQMGSWPEQTGLLAFRGGFRVVGRGRVPPWPISRLSSCPSRYQTSCLKEWSHNCEQNWIFYRNCN